MGWCQSYLLLVLMVQTVHSVPLVQAPWGTVQGVSVDGDGGRKMNAYLAIPYALPPVGDRRFEKPQPHPGPGEGEVIVADQIMPACPQSPELIGSTRKTSEDCLMLDVYMPADSREDDTRSPRAVMVFIHGGGFSQGDAYTYKPSELVVDGDVIVVIIQYRLGVLGFLTSGDKTLPGNLGLWDQNLALRWVKDNIRAFGGDSNRITIFGESAGSMSIGIHLMIPQSRGLFKRAIMQSGSPQDIVRVFEKVPVFKDLADLLGCEGDSNQQLLQCLKTQPLEDLMKKSMEYASTSFLSTYFFPVVDGELIPGDVRALAEDQVYMQENGVGDVDVMLGFNKDEGGITLFILLGKRLPMEALYSSDFFGNVMDFCFALTGLPNSSVLKKSAEFFYRRAEAGQPTLKTLDPLVTMYGDCQFNVGILEWVRYLAASPHSASRYMYVLDHEFSFNSQGPTPGAHHADELLLLFDIENHLPEDSAPVLMNKTVLSEEEKILSAALVAMWTTFAKIGNPSPPIRDDLGDDWPQFTIQNEAYLSISRSPRVVTQAGPYKDRAALWLKHLPELNALTAPPISEEASQHPSTSKEEL